MNSHSTVHVESSLARVPTCNFWQILFLTSLDPTDPYSEQDFDEVINRKQVVMPFTMDDWKVWYLFFMLAFGLFFFSSARSISLRVHNQGVHRISVFLRNWSNFWEVIEGCCS